MLTLFRTAVRAGSTRAVLNVVAEILPVFSIYMLVDRTPLSAARRRGGRKYLINQ